VGQGENCTEKGMGEVATASNEPKQSDDEPFLQAKSMPSNDPWPKVKVREGAGEKLN